jgi:hypothetical protein
VILTWGREETIIVLGPAPSSGLTLSTATTDAAFRRTASLSFFLISFRNPNQSSLTMPFTSHDL